jgi:hypothetical protein
MDVLTLRQELESLLVDELGTYTLGNGAVTPAVAVRATGEAMPSGTKVSGVELIIRRNPDLEPVNAYQREVALRKWRVYLVDWAGDRNLEQLAGRVVYAYPGCEVETVNVPEGAGPQHQMRLVITTGPDGLVSGGAT